MEDQQAVTPDLYLGKRPTRLTGRCPGCGSPIHLPFFDAATVVVQRTCRRKSCRSRFSVKIEPFPLRAGQQAGWAHVVTFTSKES